MPTITTLDDLARVLTTLPDSWATADAHGLPRSTTADAIDWTDLPTFGGNEPRSTVGVWSWDETRLLVGSCADDLRIVPRDPSLLEQTIEASGLSARRFAVEVLHVDERTVRRWLADDREMPGPVRVICRAIVSDPAVAGILAAAVAELHGA